MTVGEDRAAAQRRRTDTWADVAYGKPYLELDRRQRDGLGRLMRLADSETAGAEQRLVLDLLDWVHSRAHDLSCQRVRERGGECDCWKAVVRARLRYVTSASDRS